MPKKVGLSPSSDQAEVNICDVGSSDQSPRQMSEEGKAVSGGIRFADTVSLKEIEDRIVEDDEFKSASEKRQSVAIALHSLRILQESDDNVIDQEGIDLDKISVDEAGNVTLKNRFRHWVEMIVRPWSHNPVAMAHFRSSQSMHNEKVRQRRINRFIIHPYSIFRVFWDILMIVVLFATMLILPIEVAFYSSNLWDPNWKAFNLIVDATFIIDIFINMRTGYVINQVDEVVLDGKKIIKNYLKTWFVIDLISSIPIDYIVLSITGEEKQVLATTLRALRMVKFISLLRILRFIRLIRYLSRMKEFMHLDAKILSILRLVMAILVFAHWNACIQYLIIYIQGVPDNSWLKRANLHHENVTRWSIYSHAVYRGMSHMISIGYGKYPPEGNSETWTVIVSMMMGATFYAMFIAHVSSIVMSLDASGRHYQERVCEVKDYMRFRRLPANIQQRVIDYYEYKYQQKYFDEHAILDERHMSYPLRKAILMHNCRSLVQTVPFLRNSPSEFLVDIILKLNMHVYFPGDLIIQAGKKGDSMYFIEHGTVNIILGDGEVVNTLKDGTHFGEISLLFDEKRIADVAAVETSYIYRLAKSDFDEVLDDYPDMRAEMITVARYRLEQTQAKLGYTGSNEQAEKAAKDKAEDPEVVCELSASEEAWVEEETLNKNNSANINNVNNNENNNASSNSTQEDNELFLSPGNLSSQENSGVVYLDCTGEDAGPMVMDILAADDDDDGEGAVYKPDAVCITYSTKSKEANDPQPSVEQAAKDCIRSIVDKVVRKYEEEEKEEMLTVGLRRRHINEESCLPDVSI